MDIHARWEQFDDDYMKFGGVADKLSQRPDLHAFLWLDRRFPDGTKDIVCAAAHDEIYLDVSDEQVEYLTDDEIRDLLRCGVRHNSDGGLCMFA